MNKKYMVTTIFIIFFFAGISLIIISCGSDNETTAVNATSSFASKYIGAKACRACHEEKYNEWKETLHAKSIRDVDEPGLTGIAIVCDNDNDGKNDYVEGFNLKNTDAWSSYGDNAPVLSESHGAYKVKIGNVSYTVAKTYGGNGYWKQRYMTKIGDNYFILPNQYNEATDTWVQYHASDWYSGTTPIYTDTPSWADVKAAGKDYRAFEAQCAGCHNTGLTVEYDANSGYKTEYVDMNTSCENCHGPGMGHKAARESNLPFEKGEIICPSDLSSLDLQNLVCGRCHSRGSGPSLDGGTHNLGYPAKTVGAASAVSYAPGDTPLSDFYTITTTASKYYGFDATPEHADKTMFEDRYGHSMITSKSHHQQYLDILNGPHAPDQSYDHPCFDCHDSHKNAKSGGAKHQIITRKNEDGVLIENIDNDNNTLCLSCHATHGDWAAITAVDVQNEAANLAAGGASLAVIDSAVVAHMKKEANMNVTYNPAGGPGRCSKCHNPKTAKSATYLTDKAGNNLGDIHSHTFNIMYPNFSVLEGSKPTNSCNGCHFDGISNPTIKGDTQITQWANSGHANYGTPGSHDPFVYPVNSEHSTSVCKRCHSGKDYVTFVESYVNMTTTVADNVLKDSWSEYAGANTVNPSVLLCSTCHDPDDTGTIRSVKRVVLPDTDDVITNTLTESNANKSMVCMTCHQPRAGKIDVQNALKIGSDNEVGTPITSKYSLIDPHYFLAAGTLYSMGGYEYDSGIVGAAVAVGDYDADANNAHKTTSCIGCHMATDSDTNAIGGHTWHIGNGVDTLVGEVCQTCHNGAGGNPANMTSLYNYTNSAKDYDGDGSVEGIKKEIDGLLDLLSTTIVADDTVDTAISYPYWSLGAGGADGKHVKAMFNYRFILKDPGAFAHNAKYAVRLLQNSIYDLDSTFGGRNPDRP